MHMHQNITGASQTLRMGKISPVARRGALTCVIAAEEVVPMDVAALVENQYLGLKS